MPKFLSKQYGPFTGGVWLVVIAGGVGLGLVMRRFMGGGDTGEFTASAAGDTTPVAPAFMGGGTTLNQGEIVSEVIEAIKTQTPPPATTDPTNLSGGAATVQALERKLAGLKAQLSALGAQYTSLKNAYVATPVSKAAKRKELYAEMEKNQAQRRTLGAQIAGVTAELTYAKSKLVVAT